MSRQFWFAILGSILVTIASVSRSTAAEKATASTTPTPEAAAPIGLFEAMDGGQVDVKFIAKNDRAARILITNKLEQPVQLKLPEAFAGVPVLAQRGGGGFGGGGFGGGGRGGGGFGGGGTGGGQQSVGGGLGGGGLGGGGLGGGGGGGFFSIPPEQTAKINVAVVCLDHGLQNPSSSNPYKMVPAEEHLDRPAVIELLKAFGRGELNHGATQAAAWHLNNDLSWTDLAAKLAGTRRSPSRPPYFSRDEIRAGMAYAAEAIRLADANVEYYQQALKDRREKDAVESENDSESRSTTDE
jgi:hypothetical protein